MAPGSRRRQETKMRILACLGKAMYLYNKQHLSNIWGSIHEKVKQHWGLDEKSVSYEKSV